MFRHRIFCILGIGILLLLFVSPFLLPHDVLGQGYDTEIVPSLQKAQPTPTPILTVRVGFYENPPKIYTEPDGSISGFWPELIHFIATEEGWEIEWVRGTWEQGMERLEQGQIDIMPDVAWSEPRSQKYIFSTQRVLISWSRLYAHPGSQIETILDLEGKTIAGLAESINMEGPEGIKDITSQFGIHSTFVDMDSYTEVFEALEKGEIDAGITNKDFGNQNDQNYQIARTSFIFQPAHIDFAFPKDGDLTPVLQERIDAHLESLKATDNSIYYQLLEKYLEQKTAVTFVEFIPTWVKTLALVGGGVILFLLAVGITSRAQARRRTAELRQSEEEYRTLFDEAYDGIMVLDEQSNTLDVNRRACEILGYSKAELMVTSPAAFIHEDDFASKDHHAALVQLLAGKSIQVEYRMRKKDGSYVPIELSTKILGVGRFLNVLRDITERKTAVSAQEKLLTEITEARQAAEAASELLGSVFDRVNDGIVGLDKDWHYTYVNQNAAELLNTESPADLIGKNIWTEFPHGVGKPFYDAYYKAMETQESAVLVEYYEPWARWFENRIYPSPDGLTIYFTEITARKKAEQKLQENQELLQAVIEGTTDAIFVKDINGRYLLGNTASANMVGKSAADFIGQDDTFIFPPADAAAIKANDQQVMDSRQTSTYEELIVLATGKMHTISATKGPLFDADGKVVGVFGISRDITERKQAEMQLRLQSTALEAAANAIIIMDHDMNIEWANPAFTTLTGYSLAEVLGRNANEINKSEFKDETVYKNLERTMMAGEVWRGERINRRKDGSLYTEEVTTTPLLDANGAISHFIEIKQDVSERKASEADRARLLTQVREQAQQVQQIIETVPEGVLLLDAEGHALLANPIAEEGLSFLASASRGDVINELGGRALPELLADPPDGMWHEIDYNGRTFEVIARPVGADTTAKQWVMVISDVTEARTQSRYQQAQERLVTVGQLAAGIAHDFNNILGVITLYAELLQKTPNLSPKDHKQLALIKEQAHHAANLVAQILDFSRRSLMARVNLNLVTLVNSEVGLLKRTLSENIQLKAVYNPKEISVLADPTRLRQVLMNLAINARDAMPEGGQLQFVLSTRSVRADQPSPLPDMTQGDWAQLDVSDTGMGIAPAVFPRLFEPFFTTKEPGQGTGLGLAQVYGIVKQHGGFIDVQSQMGAGTTFTIYLPLLPETAVKETDTSERDALPQGKEVILLVEDNAAMRLSVSEILSGLGYEVLLAENGREALELFTESKDSISLIISDLVMPEMGGLALYRAIREQQAQAKILIITGYPIQQGKEELREAGIVDWLQKPFSIAALANKVREALGSSA